MKGWIEVFRAGKHTDSAGNEREWTEADLKKIASSYDPEKHEAPAVVGHPKDNAPAYGWVEALKVKGNTLLAKFTQVAEEFADAVEAGRYKKRSISLYPDLTLRHVGFLGAQPPAVKGLADIKFNADDEALVIEFEEQDFSEAPALARELASFAQNLREFIIEKHSAEDADKLVPKWLTRAEAWSVPVPPAIDNTNSISSMSEGAPDMTDKNKAADHAENDKTKHLEEHLNKLSQQLEAERAQRRNAEIASFADGLVEKGRLTPAQRESAVTLLGALDGADPVEFGEGGEAATKAPSELFREFLEGLPQQVEFREAATKNKAADTKAAGSEDYGHDAVADQEFAEADAAIRKLAKEKSINYAEAAAIYFEEQ